MLLQIVFATSQDFDVVNFKHFYEKRFIKYYDKRDSVGAHCMRKIIVYIFSIAFAVIFLSTPLVYSSSKNLTIPAIGVIQYSAFYIRGAGVAMNVFEPSARNYQPSAWQILEDLGINVIRVWGGIEGDINHLNIRNYPDEWTQNLDAFLTEADSHGIKVMFHNLGMSWGTLFGIVSPGDTAGPAPPTPIDEAKAMIDQMAGDNPLGHDFITDPRVVGWRTSNEVNISDAAILSWNLELCDYIRSLGGKAWLSSPSTFPSGNYFNGLSFQQTEPLLRGHVDYLEVHLYEVWDFDIYYSRDYTKMYNHMKNLIQNFMLDGRGAFSVDQLILGEFGIWIGTGNEYGTPETFSDEDRQTYYQAYLDACRDMGLKNVALHDFFSQIYPDGTYETPNWGIVDVDGSYYPYVADVVKDAYTS